MATTVKRKLFKAGGWGIAKRLIKPIPIIGSLFAVGLAAYEIRKKGLIPGAVHVGLDVTPVVGTAKNVVEIFTGDWIPDKPTKTYKLTSATPSTPVQVTGNVSDPPDSSPQTPPVTQ
ncbi:MAG TPA: hypothetical protein VJ023_09445 [Pyrinomonadaceae bacterium]|nr:hypothetical protein [Pyrinomonadaceae bacterium]